MNSMVRFENLNFALKMTVSRGELQIRNASLNLVTIPRGLRRKAYDNICVLDSRI